MKNGFVTFTGKWQKGDQVTIDLGLMPQLVEANPLVEESKNQVAVKYGPVVYCLEAADIEGGYNINDVQIPADIALTPVDMTIAGHTFKALEGTAKVVTEPKWNNNQLYRPVSNVQKKDVRIRLIPYYAWGNRGNMDMTVWMNLER